MTDRVGSGHHRRTLARSPELLATERTAVVVFCLLVLGAALGAELYRRLWVLALLLTALLWLIALSMMIANLVSAIRDNGLTSRERVRSGAAVPLAIALFLLLSWVAALPERAAASLYLTFHQAQFAVAVSHAGPTQAAAIPYLEGVPDGGVAIVHSPVVRPEQLSQEEQVRLTGERIHRCRRIVGAWLCGYD